jgi:hypothetical protein
MINPPLTKRRTATNVDFSFNEIAKAMIDKITGIPPKMAPLIAWSNGRNPLSPSSDVDCVTITSAPYIISKASEMNNNIIDIFVFITNWYIQIINKLILILWISGCVIPQWK